MQEPAPGGGTIYNGWWNPDGTGSFRLLDVVVTSGETEKGPVAADPVLSLKVVSNPDCPPAKLVDLDPQFQMGSMLWGLQLVLTNGATEYLRGDFEPAPFRDLFFGRVKGVGGSKGASARFTSRLGNLRWNAQAPASKLLAALKASADANGGFLSANLVTFAYDTGAQNPTFTLGRMIGAIGPWRSGEPRLFTAGRRFAPVIANPAKPFSSQPDNIGFFDAVVGARAVFVDLGFALPLASLAGDLTNLGKLSLVALKAPDVELGRGSALKLTPGCAQGATVTPADYVAIGDIPYQDQGWLMKTAGIHTLPLPPGAAKLATSPLALVVTDAKGKQRVAIRETIGGYFVRADDFVQRVDACGHPVQTEVELRCTRFGKPFAGAVQLQLAGPDPGEGGTGDPNEVDPPAAQIPVINIPASAIHFARTAPADAGGKAVATITLDDPANVRKYLDGQIYTVTYAFGFTGESAMPPFEQILLHVRDAFDPPASPDWTADVEPVLRQFGNLYPIMSHGLFSFSDPKVVAKHAGIMMFALDKPIEDPNHMPATRDMSEGKRKMLLTWLAGKAGVAAPARREAGGGDTGGSRPRPPCRRRRWGRQCPFITPGSAG